MSRDKEVSSVKTEALNTVPFKDKDTSKQIESSSESFKVIS